jgi:hypothetical protein
MNSFLVTLRNMWYDVIDRGRGVDTFSDECQLLLTRTLKGLTEEEHLVMPEVCMALFASAEFMETVAGTIAEALRANGFPARESVNGVDAETVERELREVVERDLVPSKSNNAFEECVIRNVRLLTSLDDSQIVSFMRIILEPLISAHVRPLKVKKVAKVGPTVFHLDDDL